MNKIQLEPGLPAQVTICLPPEEHRQYITMQLCFFVRNGKWYCFRMESSDIRAFLAAYRGNVCYYASGQAVVLEGVPDSVLNTFNLWQASAEDEEAIDRWQTEFSEPSDNPRYELWAKLFSQK